MSGLAVPIEDTNASFILPDKTCQRLTLAEIKSATMNFEDALIIGRGGFGKVYKSLRKFGSVNQVAIKRLHSTSSQGADEFEAEVKILCNLRHGNLVPLIGYCNEGKEMVLVYEFMPNGTLEDHLHKGGTKLSWLQLLKICIGAARGLDYLHAGTSTQHGVIHRDVKTSNILLDSNFAAKISDFGLAKVGTINQTQTYVSTSVKGTFGYMDPCYYNSGQLTRKSDVYAFGVVLFEVLSGKKAVDQTLGEDEQNLAVWAQDHFKEGRLNKIVDRRLIGQISKKDLKKFASLAVQCLHSNPKQRPTMAGVVFKLESILSRERESASSGVDEGRFFNKVRNIFTGKADLMPAYEQGNSHISAQYNNQSLRIFTYFELVSVTNNCNDKTFVLNRHAIYKGWVDKLTYAPTKPGVGLAMYVQTRHIGTYELDLKHEEFNHPNLVKLLGYCLRNQHLSCVYELNPYVSLDKLLFGDPGTTSLSWFARLKIAVGTAQGLSFFHNKGQPAYSQFKTTCILVDKDYNARLQNFEVNNSLVAPDPCTSKMDEHYAAPEWSDFQANHVILESINVAGHFKDGFGVKIEIYSFGVVLLELLTGMKVFDRNRPLEKQNLLGRATRLLANEASLRIVIDPQLLDNKHPPQGAYKLALLVLSCLQLSQDKRPSMENILLVLHECYQEAVLTHKRETNKRTYPVKSHSMSKLWNRQIK